MNTYIKKQLKAKPTQSLKKINRTTVDFYSHNLSLDNKILKIQEKLDSIKKESSSKDSRQNFMKEQFKSKNHN